jgi:hypothetical protein
MADINAGPRLKEMEYVNRIKLDQGMTLLWMLLVAAIITMAQKANYFLIS